MKDTGATGSVTTEQREVAIFSALIVAFLVAVLVQVNGFAYFFSDDLPNFVTARSRTFDEHTFAFLDVHFVPLFQASDWLFLRIFGLSFGAAVVCLGLVQLLTFWQVHALLAYLRPGRAARVWTFLYATNIFLIVIIAFWSAGLHRIPCLFFVVLCLNHAVRFVDSGQARNAFYTLLGFVAALGFFEKGMLAPAYLAGVQLCRWTIRGSVPRPELKRLAICVGPMLVLAAMQVALIKQHSVVEGNLEYDPMAILRLAWGMLPVHLQGPLLLVHDRDAYAVNALVWTAYLAAFAWTVIRAPRSVVIWATAAVWFVLNCSMLVVSNRRGWAAFLPFLYRYYHELTLPFVLAGTLLCDAMLQSPRSLLAGAARVRLPKLGTAALGACLLLYGSLAVVSSFRLVNAFYPNLPAHRRRVLEAATATQAMVQEGRDFAIVETILPPEDAGLYWGRVTYGDVLRLMDFNVKYNTAAQELYAVDPRGGFERVRLTEHAHLLPGPAIELVRTFYDANGCFDARNPFGGSIEMSLPASASLERSVVVIDYTATQPDPIYVFHRADSGSPWVNRHKLSLPAGGNVTYVPLRSMAPNEPLPIGGIRIELTVREEHFCIRGVSLATYSHSD